VASSEATVSATSSTSAAASCWRTWAKAGGERVVDPALGLLDRVGWGVATLGSRAALGSRGAGRTRDAGSTGLDGGSSRRLLGLLEAEPEAVPLGVERDDLELERLTLVDDIARVGDALVGELADVDQALESVADARKVKTVAPLAAKTEQGRRAPARRALPPRARAGALASLAR